MYVASDQIDRCEPPDGAKAGTEHILRFRNQDSRFQWNPAKFAGLSDYWTAQLPGHGQWYLDVDTATRQGWRYVGPVENVGHDTI